jgi:hypothetical protein
VIRRKRRKSASLAYKQSAPIGIGQTRRQDDEAAHAHRVEVIRLNRIAVFERDWRGCRAGCGARPRESDHCHEVLSRAMMRGRPPEDVFNLVNCIRLCAACHQKITEHKIDTVIVDPVAGCNGEVRFVAHRSRWEQ